MLLFESHKEYFPEPSLTIPSKRHPAPKHHGHHPWALVQQDLVRNDVVEVPLKYACEVLGGRRGSDWALGYALTVHSSQGRTIAEPQKVWIINDYLQWSNLAYLAVSHVESLHPLERVVCPRKRVSVKHTASLPRYRGSGSAKSSRQSW